MASKKPQPHRFPFPPACYLVETCVRDEEGDVALHHNGLPMRWTMAVLGPPEQDMVLLHEQWLSTLNPHRRKPRPAGDFLLWLASQPGWSFPYHYGAYRLEDEELWEPCVLDADPLRGRTS